MRSQRREREIVRARWIAMLLAREMCSATLMEIGRVFGRDHTSVLHALQRVATITDAEFHRDIEAVRRRIEEWL